MPRYRPGQPLVKCHSGPTSVALFSDTGVVQESGKKFWSTKDPGQQPFSYQAGVGQVIKGWDQGLLGMRLGEERQVTEAATLGDRGCNTR